MRIDEINTQKLTPAPSRVSMNSVAIIERTRKNQCYEFILNDLFPFVKITLVNYIKINNYNPQRPENTNDFLHTLFIKLWYIRIRRQRNFKSPAEHGNRLGKSHFGLEGWRIETLHIFVLQKNSRYFYSKKIIVFLFLAKRMRKNRAVAANNFGANCRQYYANYIFEHTERRTRKWKRHSFDSLQSRLLDWFDGYAACTDRWMDRLAVNA